MFQPRDLPSEFFEGGDEWGQLRSPVGVELGGKAGLFGLAAGASG
ncbi:hypothetical protein AB0D83_20250 [Streptomyces decoyicus]